MRWRSKYIFLFVCLLVAFILLLLNSSLHKRSIKPAVSVLSPLEGRPHSELRSALRLTLSSPEYWDSKSESTG